jgi:putative spermidine/putrescine transport system permease protein
MTPPAWPRIILAVGIVLWVILPFVSLLLWAFGAQWFFPALLPEEFSLRAWQYVARPTADVAEAFFNSLLISVMVTLFAALVGIPAGRALGLHRFPAKAAVELFILAPLIVPPITVAMGIHVVFIRLGLVDRLIGVILVHLIPTVPYMTVVMRGVFANFERGYEEQARSLGARPLQVLFRVTLPAIVPGIMTGGLFVFLVSWSQYILTLLIGGGRVVTLPVLLFAFASSGDNTVTAAISLIFVAPAIAVLAVTARYLTGRSAALGGLGRM